MQQRGSDGDAEERREPCTLLVRVPQETIVGQEDRPVAAGGEAGEVARVELIDDGAAENVAQAAEAPGRSPAIGGEPGGDEVATVAYHADEARGRQGVGQHGAEERMVRGLLDPEAMSSPDAHLVHHAPEDLRVAASAGNYGRQVGGLETGQDEVVGRLEGGREAGAGGRVGNGPKATAKCEKKMLS